MKAAWQLVLRLTLTFAIILIAGCAVPARTGSTYDAENAHWQGRLAVKVYSTPVQAFSADFDLQGSARAGTLVFSSPLGSTVARLQWDATSAQLQTTGAPRYFDSLDALTRQATGTELPIASLFAWLQGSDPRTPGWRVDLQNLPNGRLSAQRLPPETPADLTILLER
ncbi:MAG: outer membrane lipoprotein LolB [Rhodoferax sp.]